jgi:hypothetical protein
MASCQVDIIGTSGTVYIQYTLGSNLNTLTSNYGDTVYIDDTATNLGYVTTSGDAVPSSMCLSIDPIDLTYLQFKWETIGKHADTDLKFFFTEINELVFDDSVGFNKSDLTDLCQQIKNTLPSAVRFYILSEESERFSFINTLIVQSMEDTPLELTVLNEEQDTSFYLKTTEIVEVPEEATELELTINNL